jgi:hypothetical protein
MTLLQAMQLLLAPEPLDPEDPHLSEAVQVVYPELHRLAPMVIYRVSKQDLEDVVNAAALKLFVRATRRHRGGGLESETEAGARKYLKKVVYSVFDDRFLKPKRGKRGPYPKQEPGEGGSGHGEPGTDPDLIAELQEAIDEFENDIPETICRRKRERDAEMFNRTFASLRALRDKRTTTEILIEEEAGDAPPERLGQEWKAIRSRIQVRMKRCREEIDAEIRSRRESGRIDEQREHWLKLLLGQIQFHESPKKKVKRSASDPDYDPRQGGRRKGKRSSAPSGGTK